MRPAQQLWLRAIRHVKADGPTAASIWADLERRYSEPHRHYHTVSHIDSMAAKAVRMSVDALPVLDFAVVYHDAIYDPKKNDNEEMSADLAAQQLRALGGDQQTLESVANLILCTKNHHPLPTGHRLSKLSETLLDLDLMIFSSSPEEYDAYAAKIRREYEWVPEQEYRQKRSEILRNFVGRRRLYFLDEFHDRHDYQARANLKREIELLSK